MLEIQNSNGSLTTDENKNDKIARGAWEKVFEGNIHGEDKMISNFMEKYKKHIFRNEEEKIEPLDWKDVKNACSNTNPAGGLDVWPTKRTPHDI